MQVQELLETHSALLVQHEEKELRDYDVVYYLGDRAEGSQKHQNLDLNLNFAGNSKGVSSQRFDDEHGDYLIKIKDHLAFRYEIIDVLGKGTFGQVVRCIDHKRNEEVAVKIIKNKKSYHKQAIIELKILQKLRQSDPEGKYNVVKIKNYFLFRKHICISFELLSISLYDLLTQNNFEGLSLVLIHRFAVQLLVCLQFISKQNIIHCDLKPENILLKSTEKALINIIDFGSAWETLEKSKKNFYIQSRFYRAPEVILEIDYSHAIDIWSLGCILAELFTGFPLFPGETEHHQLICIMAVIGAPPQELIKASGKRNAFFHENMEPRIVQDHRNNTQMPGSVEIRNVLRGASQNFIDFVEKCLVWRPESRIKPLEGLEHPWITEGLRRKNTL